MKLRFKKTLLFPRAFSLLEILIAVVIIATLSAIAVPLYHKSKEHALGMEAVANLKLIYAAEQLYNMDHGVYMACSCGTDAQCNGAAGCNTLLKLNLSPTNWDYSVSLFGGGVWLASADRQGAGAQYLDCQYRVSLSQPISSANPYVNSGTCP